MLWKKSWWDTRWPFLIFLAIVFLAYFLMFAHGYDASNWIARLQRSASLGESERNALNNYQGHTWALWFKLFFNVLWADFAVVLGAACLMTVFPWPLSQGAVSFTFSLPASRRKVLLSQAAVGFGEMFLLALIPSLFLPLVARFQGQWFSWSDALIYALLMIFGGAVFFFFSFLLTVILGNWLAAFVMAESLVIALFLNSLPFGTRPWWNILGVMAGESYFYQRQIPWLGLLISLILSAVFIFTAIRIYERRDL
jgi:ABC-type transport system involved in multi-copper enzyme maturation permease subunit